MSSAIETPSHSAVPHPMMLALTVGAIGVVFGDIGTSPLYAFREALALSAHDGLDPDEILGVLSLTLWSLILVVSVKYIIFLMRADNQGEGGVLALTALARRALGRRSMIALVLGAAGAALFYGDAIITPALSVLSAVEGLRTIPGGGDIVGPDTILFLTIAILIALFVIQARGTAHVSKLFGPVCILWFLTIGGLGLWHIWDEPSILRVFLPWYGGEFLATHGITGLFVLGAVFLTVTGAEALTADMGHFGPAPIRLGWFALVFPSLLLNYLGQGAFALNALEVANAAHRPFANQDWFFLMAPGNLRPWLIALAMLATVIASQAVITGAYSLTQQAIQLGLLPRLRVRQTSASHSGQIYLPAINWLLLVGVLVLVIQFRNSSAMAAAYGIAVTGTMVVTTANINCRIFPGETVEGTLATLKALAGPKVKVTANQPIRPTAIPPTLDPKIVGPAKAVAAKHFPGLPLLPPMSTGATDGIFFEAIGIPVYGAPGIFVDSDFNGIHGLNERIRVKSLYDGRDYLFDLVKAYAG